MWLPCGGTLPSSGAATGASTPSPRWTPNSIGIRPSSTLTMRASGRRGELTEMFLRTLLVPSQKLWAIVSSSPAAWSEVARNGGWIFFFNSIFHIMGLDHRYSNEIFKLDMKSLSWSKMSPEGTRPLKSDKMSSWVDGQKVYLFGGYGKPGYAK